MQKKTKKQIKWGGKKTLQIPFNMLNFTNNDHIKVTEFVSVN